MLLLPGMGQQVSFLVAPLEPRDPVCACGHGRSLHAHREGICDGCESYLDAGIASPWRHVCLRFAEYRYRPVAATTTRSLTYSAGRQ
jgi:hypothetical protein